MTICYLDPEDEITGAVARLRAVEDGEAVIVLPPGSRIATSRINFRLLAREAEHHHLSLVAVSDEPGVRALAISAGLPAYDSIAAAEGGLSEFRRQEQRLAERLGSASAGGPRRAQDGPAAPPAARAAPRKDDSAAPAPAAPASDAAPSGANPPSGRPAAPAAAPTVPAASPRDRRAQVPDDTRPIPAANQRRRQPSDATRPLAIPAIEAERRSPPGGAGGEPPDADAEDALAEPYGRRRRPRRRWRLTPLLTILLLLALVGVAAYGGYVLVPTATVTIRPHLAGVGPVSAEVVADPRVAVVDPGAGIIPAQRLELPLSVSGDFDATGTRVTTVRAAGSVRFTSQNTVSEVPIPAGTRVTTRNGIAFETTADRVVPRAVFATGTEGEIDAPVRAVRAGLRGNVAANAISVLPDVIADQLVQVTNPEATTGGARREATIVTAADYDAAVNAMGGQLDEALAEVLADPATTPRGLTVFPDSADIGEPATSPPRADLVNQVVDRFSLTVTAAATLLAVNESQVDEVVVEQLRALAPPGSTIVDESVEASHTPGEPFGGSIVFSASANGRAYRLPDRDELVAEIRGLPVTEAREIIGRYGVAELTVWPDFVDRVPDQPARINLTILPPTETT